MSCGRRLKSQPCQASPEVSACADNIRDVVNEGPRFAAGDMAATSVAAHFVMSITLSLAHRADWPRCFSVVAQLRPHLDEAAFLAQVERQSAAGFQLLFAEDDGEVRAVAGFRVIEMLAHGRFLYVDDLITDEAHRSKGFGAALLQWLENYAPEANCESLQLDSGVQRHDEHRFYFVSGLTIASYHFKKPV